MSGSTYGTTSISKPSRIIAWLFAAQAVLLIAVSIFFYSVIDPSQFHASYFTEHFNLAAFVFGPYTIGMSLFYYFNSRRGYTWAGLLHFFMGLPLFLLTFLDRLGLIDHGPPRRYYVSYDSRLPDLFPIFEMQLYFLFVILFLAGLVVFLLNQILSMLGRNKHQL